MVGVLQGAPPRNQPPHPPRSAFAKILLPHGKTIVSPLGRGASFPCSCFVSMTRRRCGVVKLQRCRAALRTTFRSCRDEPVATGMADGVRREAILDLVPFALEIMRQHRSQARPERRCVGSTERIKADDAANPWAAKIQRVQSHKPTPARRIDPRELDAPQNGPTGVPNLLASQLLRAQDEDCAPIAHCQEELVGGAENKNEEHHRAERCRPRAKHVH